MQTNLPKTDISFRTDVSCRKAMQGAYIQACDTNSHDLLGLYLTLEKIFQKHYELGNVKEGLVFEFDMGLGVTLRLKFYNKATEIYADNYLQLGQKSKIILSKEQSWRREYTFLENWSDVLKLQGLSIGKTVPDKFLESLRKLKPGMIVSFTEGRSYVCKENKDGQVTLNKIFDGDIRNINLESFCKQEPIILSLYDRAQAQAFYKENKKLLTQNMEADYAFLDKCYLQIRQMEQDISILHSKKVQIGPISLIAKAGFGGEVKWFDSQGKRVTKEQLAYLLGLLNTQPIQTKYERKKPSLEKTTEDSNFRHQIEKMLDAKEYEKAYEKLLEYSNENEDDLIIRTIGFLKRNKEFMSFSIIFRNGKAFKVFQSGAFSEEEQLSLMTEEEFVAFCKAKYTDTYNRIYTKTMKEIREIYKNRDARTTKNQEAVAERITKSRIEQETGLVFGEQDVLSGETELDDVMDNMDESYQPILFGL